MAKKQGISYSADAGLIRGEGAMRQAGSFVDAAKSIGAGFDVTSKEMARGIAARKNEQAKIDANVANSIRAMKGNVDVTGLTATDQKAVNTFLIEQKDIYAQAANVASTLKPGTPEYTAQVDIMNNVNNSFVALKENLNSYELGKTQYIDSSQDFSEGNNIGNKKFTSDVFTNKNPFRVGAGGNLIFSSDKGDVDFKDIDMPFKKNYEAALELDNMYKAVYSSGGFDESQRNSFETKLRAMAASNPDAFKSVAADGLNSYANYNNITPDMYDDPTKENEFIEAFIQNTLNGAQKAAANGKAAKKSDDPNNNKGARTPTPSAIKYGEEVFINGKSMGVYDYGYGYDADGNSVKYYRKPHGDKGWTTTLGDAPDPTTTPTTTTTVPNEYPEWVTDKKLYDDLISQYPNLSKEMYDYKIEQKNKK